jgi:hypothetical protein
VSIAALQADKAEGNLGPTEYTFTVTRSNGAGTSAVDWTVAGTGSNPAAATDFAVTSGTVAFADGEVSKTVTIRVNGDRMVEADEGFSVTLTNPSSAVIGNAVANGVIRNDDQTVVPNQVPTDITMNNYSVQELAATNGSTGLVGILSAVDSDSTSGFTYTLLDSADGRFKIVGNQLLVDNGFKLDHEQATSHQVKVRVADNMGGVFDKNLTISVTDL